jgi:transcriptional regulator with XRE-family HTH domain
MGKLYDLIQEHIDSQQYPPSPRQVAKQLGVTQTTLSNWREPKQLIDKKHLLAIAQVTRNPYARVLDALLQDIGYRDAGAPPPTPPPTREERPA